MCGIVGYIGKDKCIPKIIYGLESLEYRGYDSAGIAYKKGKKIIIEKEQGRLSNLTESLKMDENAYLGIGHTRWATHGKPSKVNSHPHSSNEITLVHNGIIENYEELKAELPGYKFKSETDTEVVSALIDKLYKEEKDPVDIVVGDLTGEATKVAAQAQIAIPAGSSVADVIGTFADGVEGDNVTDAEAYSAVFAAIDLTGKNAPEAYGFAVIDKNGVAPTRIFEAKKVYGGKFGVAFFGTAEVLNWYKAAPAVKVNGTWIYDVNKASNL